MNFGAVPWAGTCTELPGVSVGYSTAVSRINSSFINTFCTGGCFPGLQQQSVASSSFIDFTSSPMSPSKSHTKPRNWSKTPEALTSSNVQEDFAFQEE